MMKKIVLNVTAGTLLMLLIGIIYSYSIFRVEIEDIYAVSSVKSGLPYMLVLFFYSFFMFIGGRLYTRYNTFLVGMVGTVLIISGFIFSSMTSSIEGLMITYGVLAGSGIGILYGLPLRIVSQLNHKRIGLLTGVTLFGYGLSSLMFAPIISNLIRTRSLNNTFLYIGIIYVFLITPLVYYLSKQDVIEKTKQKSTTQLFKEKKFYVVYTLFFIVTFIGLTFIGLTSTIGGELVGLSQATTAVLVGVFAVFNGIGRPLYVLLNDKVGFRKSATISFISIIIAALSHYYIQNTTVYFISFVIFYLNFGGWLSIVPSATRELFGKREYSRNYGIMFTAYGFGAIVGTLSSGVLIETVSLESIFLLMSCLSVVGLVILMTFFKENQQLE